MQDELGINSVIDGQTKGLHYLLMFPVSQHGRHVVGTQSYDTYALTCYIHIYIYNMWNTEDVLPLVLSTVQDLLP